MDFDFMNAMTQQDTTPADESGNLSNGEGFAVEQNAPSGGSDHLPAEENTTAAGGGEGAETAEHTEPQQKEEQTQAQRAGYAAARRRAEAEWQQQKQKADAFYQRMDAMAKARGFKNIEELEAAVNAETEARAKAEIAKRNAEFKEKYGIDQDDLNKMIDDVIDNHPVIKTTRLAAGRKALDDAVAEIGKLDDRIKSFDDLPKMDNYEMFDDMVRNRGYRMVDAYKLANMDRLQAKRAAAASQEVRNSINSRKHLTQTGGGAAGDASVVPADVKALYKQFNPNASDADILAHWKKSLEG